MSSSRSERLPQGQRPERDARFRTVGSGRRSQSPRTRAAGPAPFRVLPDGESQLLPDPLEVRWRDLVASVNVLLSERVSGGDPSLAPRGHAPFSAIAQSPVRARTDDDGGPGVRRIPLA